MNGVILFRRLDEPVAPWSSPGIRWVVEFWVPDMAYPIGQAWVMDIPPSPGFENTKLDPYLDWLYVMDEYRRKGIAGKLLDACRGRWPNMNYDGATDAGEAFCDSYDKARGIPAQPDYEGDVL